MSKEVKSKLVLKKTFVIGTYIPDKKELCDLIMKDKVSICIVEQCKYESGLETMKIKINHE